MRNKAGLFLLRYGCAALSVCLATWIRILLDPVLGSRYPIATLFFAILLTVWYGGFRPALVAVVLGGLCAAYFIMPPRGSFAVEGADHQMGLVLYLITGFGIAVLGGKMEAARQNAESSAQAMRRQAVLFEQTYDAVLVWEWNGPITFWNRGAERLYGFSPAEALGRVSHDLLRTTTLIGVEGFVSALERDGSWEGELNHTTRLGQRITVETRMVLVRQAETPYVLETNRDITGRRRMEAELREANEQLEARVRERTAELVQTNESLQVSEERFRLLVEGAQDYANFMLDPTGHVITWNMGAQRSKGYRAEEIIGRHFSCFYSAEDVAAGKPELGLQQALAEGRCVDEGWRVRKDGTRFWARAVITTLNDKLGRLRGFAKVTRDITDSMRAQERFCQAVESAPNGMVMINSDGTIVLVNAQTERLFGYNRDEMLGQPVEMLVPERFRGQHPDHRKGFFALPQVRSMGVGRDLFGRRKDGSEFPVEIGLNPIKTNEGLMVLSAIVDITARKKAEDMFRQAVESAPNGMVMINALGAIVLVNAQTEKLFGYDRKELLGRPIEMLVPERFRGRHPDHRLGFFASPQVRSMGVGRDLYGLRKDGSEFPVEIGLNPISTDEGLLVLSAIVDITERKRASEALEESEARLKLFITHAPAALAVFDRDMRYLAVSRRWLTDYGFSDGTIIGRSHYDVFPTIPERWKAIHRRGMAGEVVQSDAERFERPDGSVQWLRWEMRRSAADGTVGGIVLFTEDVTERKQAETELQEKEARYRKLFEYSPDGILIVDPEGCYRDANPSICRMLGYAHDELVGLHNSDIVAKSHFQNIEPARAAIKSKADYHAEWQLLRKDRSVLAVDAIATLMPDGNFLGVIRDITERKQAEQALQQAHAELEDRVAERTAQLEAANKELEAFSYSISHDLRAPLRAIAGFSRILVKTYAEAMPPKAQEYLHDVQRNTLHMGRLVDDLLAFSRLSRQPIKKQIVISVELVRQCLEEMRGDLAGRQVDFRIGDLPPCLADPALLKQVWINLLANAIKYTNKREQTLIEIDSRPGDDPNRRTYFVKDNGVGFDMEYVHKLFGVFQRLHRSEDYEGTGVGLAIVQRIILRHGGRIWAEAEPHRGATFYFTLEEGQPLHE